MPSLLIRLLLFLSSYFPLAVIFFVLLRNAKPLVAWSLLALGLIGLVGMVLYFLAVRRLNPLRVQISSISRRDGEAMSYIVTYLLPFLAAPFGDFDQAVGLAVFFGVLAVLYVNSDMIHINPMLNLLGYHIYDVELENGEVRSLIAKRRIRRGQQAAVVSAGSDVLLEVKE